MVYGARISNARIKFLWSPMTQELNERPVFKKIPPRISRPLRNSRARSGAGAIGSVYDLRRGLASRISYLIDYGLFYEAFGEYEQDRYGNETFSGTGIHGDAADIKRQFFHRTHSESFWPFVPGKIESLIGDKEEIFLACEVGFDYVSLPVDDGGFNGDAGKEVYISEINSLLNELEEGFQIDASGNVTRLLDPYTESMLHQDYSSPWEVEVSQEIFHAIEKVKNRNSDEQSWKDAIIQLHGVFEFLRKRELKVLAKKDRDSLGRMANEFGVRHNTPGQNRDYDKLEGYKFMFRVHLASILYVLAEVRLNPV